MAELPAREAMEFDVVIVGAGPAGLAAAIRLKQISADINVVVVEKGSEVGAHILSGAVIDPVGLDRLLPDWRSRGHADQDRGHATTASIVLSASRRAAAAEFPDAAADEQSRQLHRLARQCLPLAGAARRKRSASRSIRALPQRKCCTTTNGAVAGVATGDMGVGKNGEPKDSFTRGMELRAKYTLFAEGARGNLGKQLIAKFNLGDGREPQKFGIGLKELWQVAPEKHQHGPGAAHLRLAARQHDRRRLVPLSLRRQSGVGRLRGASQLQQSLSLAVRGIPALQDASAGARHLRRRQAARLWRARADRRRLPVGAEARLSRRRADRLRRRLHERAAHQGQPQRHAVGHDGGGSRRRGARRRPRARRARRLRARTGAPRRSARISGACATPSRCGRSSAPSSASRSAASTCGATRSASRCSARSSTASRITRRSSRPPNAAPIAYPKPDGKLTFDRLSSVFLSNTNHEEDQPVHLQVKDMGLQKSSEHDVFAGPSARYCPAGVYEWVEEARQSPKYRDQRAELRPLQNLRHQGPESEHQLGAARRRRRAELSEYVTRATRFPSRCCRYPGLQPRAGATCRGRGCGGGAKSPFSAPKPRR